MKLSELLHHRERLFWDEKVDLSLIPVKLEITGTGLAERVLSISEKQEDLLVEMLGGYHRSFFLLDRNTLSPNPHLHIEQFSDPAYSFKIYRLFYKND